MSTLPDAIRQLDRPNGKVYAHYFANALLLSLTSCGIALPFLLLGMLPVIIRLRTMRYRIDDDGVGLSFGWLNRHESHITYDKIQDIHVNRGWLERMFGLGTVQIQTASGSSTAEVALVGLTEFDAVRDFLYSRMRGGEQPTPQPEGDDVLVLLRGIRDEVTALGKRLEAQGG